MQNTPNIATVTWSMIQWLWSMDPCVDFEHRSITSNSPREPHALAWGLSSSHTKIFRVERARLKTGETRNCSKLRKIHSGQGPISLTINPSEFKFFGQFALLWFKFSWCQLMSLQFLHMTSMTLAPGNPTLWRGVPVTPIQKYLGSSERDWKPGKKLPIPCKFCTYRFIRYSSTCYGKVRMDPLMTNIRNPYFFASLVVNAARFVVVRHVIWIGIC